MFQSEVTRIDVRIVYRTRIGGRRHTDVRSRTRCICDILQLRRERALWQTLSSDTSVVRFWFTKSAVAGFRTAVHRTLKSLRLPIRRHFYLLLDIGKLLACKELHLRQEICYPPMVGSGVRLPIPQDWRE